MEVVGMGIGWRSFHGPLYALTFAFSEAGCSPVALMSGRVELGAFDQAKILEKKDRQLGQKR